ncbi:unnamed protein product [Rotaria sordida]|uniref:Uncharacterized protein n=1 Tax=Rotaria sordida TaxID=392033 RepID=A0A819T1K6_9BILA|nr:unnamed protein product [Rotaria sordida]CAF4071216.1 unnamed protein product [Rotaria sordida]
MYAHNEALADEELIERFKELINEFMIRPDRHYSHNTNMSWTIDHGNQIKYSVGISINQTYDSDTHRTLFYYSLSTPWYSPKSEWPSKRLVKVQERRPIKDPAFIYLNSMNMV